MKILHVIPSLNKGGAERLVLDICNELSQQKDVQVKLITFRSNNAYSFLSETLNWEVIPSRVIPSISGKAIVEVGQLQKTIKDFKPDVIHSHLFETEMVLSQINYSKAKYVVHFHDNMVQFENLTWSTFNSKHHLTNYFEKRIVLRSYKSKQPVFIGISKDSFAYIHKILPNQFEKILLNNAIDTKRFIPNIDFVKTNRITIIGSLVEKKGQELAVRTMHELEKRGHKFLLDILGDGPDKKALEQLANSLSLANSVHFHGNIDHPEEFLNKSMLYLHTAKYEPFGLVLLEAMACGLPVVCTDGGGNKDLINEGINGFLVKERNPHELADKIELLYSNHEIRQKMRENARKFAEGFDIENYVKKLLSIYQS